MGTLNDEAYDVPDSTDWLSTPLACFMPVEQAFRCHVCKDFFNSPMLTSCNHTFCSICIRRCLATDGKCPLCRAADQESKLRGNWALREAVEAFTQARPTMLQFVRAAAAARETSLPKRKAAEIDGVEDSDAEGNKRPRMLTRSSKQKGADTTSAMIKGETYDHETENQNDGDFQPDDGLVACPICLTRMKDWQVDKHLDTSCPGSPQPQRTTTSTQRTRNTNAPASRTSAAGPSNQTAAPSRLPTLAYSMLKDAQLRKKLGELGLFTQGTRQDLERRHMEWITIWNANCDSARPKTKSELLHDLDVWERTIGSRAPTASRSANAGAYIKDKDFDGAAWAEKHGDSFRDLIADARRTRSRAEKTVEEEPAEPAEERPQAPAGSESSDGQGAGPALPSAYSHRDPGREEPIARVVSAANVVDLTGPDPSLEERPGFEMKGQEGAGHGSSAEAPVRLQEPQQLRARDGALPAAMAINTVARSNCNAAGRAPS